MTIDRTSVASSSSIAELKGDLLRAVPKLRAYAKVLCRSTDRADDLVQEALVKALAHINTFEPGSNMIAWLYTILRNEFYSDYRKRRHEVEDDGDRHAALLRIRPTQEGHMYFLDVRNALNRLTTEHREALMLIVSGMSYEDAAELCGHAIGTMKSRVSRARTRLTSLLDDREADDCGDPDRGSASRGPPKRETSEDALAFA